VTALTFGFVPEPGVMNLSRYGDFVNTIISGTGSWPTDTVIDFRFLPDNATSWVIWPATILGATASWSVDKALVASLLTSGATEYWLMYTQSTSVLEWSHGPVVDVS
jgi:hypothetical protein